MMSVITTPLGPVALLAVAYLGTLFADLTRRLSAVRKTPDHYGWFRVGSSFVTVAAFSQAVRGIAALAPHLAPPVLLETWFAVLSYHIPLCLGVTLLLALVLHHWKWTLTEKLD
jgi:hypothetical protein